LGFSIILKVNHGEILQYVATEPAMGCRARVAGRTDACADRRASRASIRDTLSDREALPGD